MKCEEGNSQLALKPAFSTYHEEDFGKLRYDREPTLIGAPKPSRCPEAQQVPRSPASAPKPSRCPEAQQAPRSPASATKPRRCPEAQQVPRSPAGAPKPSRCPEAQQVPRSPAGAPSPAGARKPRRNPQKVEVPLVSKQSKTNFRLSQLSKTHLNLFSKACASFVLCLRP